MESTIIVAFITALGTIINTVISKKTNKKLNNINDASRISAGIIFLIVKYI